ncbi:hypothetical protein EIP86_002182 [Pleurotus ostreatoroseus]|nr:hypothetical protein EIP86_002182 [Pleurotus ostreatoroseus]
MRRHRSTTDLDAMRGHWTPIYPPTTPSTPLSRWHQLPGASPSSPDTMSVPRPAPSPSPISKKPPSVRRTRRSEDEKIEIMMDALKTCNWTLGEFLHAMFKTDDSRGPRHAKMASRFLNGTTAYSVGDILKCWLEDPSGKPGAEEEEVAYKYSLDKPYLELKHAQVVLTAFAAQLVKAEMLREIRRAVESSSGLHGTVVSPKGRKQLAREGGSRGL